MKKKIKADTTYATETPDTTITTIMPSQLWAARSLINWTRSQCGKATGLASETIKNIERGSNKYGPEKETLIKLVSGFAAHGVYFLERKNIFGVWRIFAPSLSKNEIPVFNIAERMAASILVLTAELKRPCKPQDLRNKGYTLDEVARYWPEAKELALSAKPKASKRS